MVKVNGKEVEWEDPPKGEYQTDVKIHVLWKNADTGAVFRLVKIPVGGFHDRPHMHPDANQWECILSGEEIMPDGTQIEWSEGNYRFTYRAKGVRHAIPTEGMQFTKDIIVLQFYDGPPTKISN